MMQLLFRMFRRNTTTGKCTSHVLRRGFSVGARLGALALGALALLSCDKPQTPQGSRARVLNLYSWTDYFPPDLIADFQRETGIVVHHATFPSLEVSEATLLTGHSGYDVVVTGATPCNAWLPPMHSASWTARNCPTGTTSTLMSWPAWQPRMPAIGTPWRTIGGLP